MKATFFESLSETTPIIGIGIVIIILFIVLKFFRAIFSISFIGLLGSLYSFFMLDYFVFKIPIIALISTILCILGFKRPNLICKLFSITGIILSGYLIINSLGLI